MIKKFFLIVFILLFSAGLYLWVGRVHLINSALGTQLPVKTSIANLSLGTDSLSIYGLNMDNLPNSPINKALLIDKVYVKVNIASLLEDVIIIEEIRIIAPIIGLEMYNASGTKNNWTKIIDLIDQKYSSPKKITEEQTSKKTARKILVKKVVLNDVAVHAYNKFFKKSVIIHKPIKEIVLEDIGSGKPIPHKQFIALIIKITMKNVLRFPQLDQVLKGTIEGTLKAPKKVFDTLLSPFKPKPAQ